MVSTRPNRGIIEIYPKFMVKNSSDLMIRGGDFYAIWNENESMWSTDEQDAIHLIDAELDAYAVKYREKHDPESSIRVLHMWDADTKQIDKWHHYCQKQLRDCYHMLDETIIFSNTEVTKDMYASKRLDYPLIEGNINAYDELISVLYSPEERHKIEWSIGSIVTGASKTLQKFAVLYGAMGTGKSTVLDIVEKLFKGYFSTFDAKALGSSSNAFALEPFKTNPLVAIQHDGDLSHIEDNTRLNSLVSHELMTVNEKHKSLYSNRFKCFLFLGTNKPVKITDAKSGLIRRLIDISPTGNKVSYSDYLKLTNQINFELGAIASHCRSVYLSDPNYYDNYIPISMLGATNDFYNFVIESYPVFKREDGTTLKTAWEMYKVYCDDAKVTFPYPQRVFKEELKNYFREYIDRGTSDDGTRVRSYYKGFRTEKFEDQVLGGKQELETSKWLDFKSQDSFLDSACSECIAQYAGEKETPLKKWENVTTKLKDLDTSKLHYLQVQQNHIIIDFDIPDETGKKSLEKNISAASKWPSTYAELSKSGQGIHLHYIYSGDVSKLSSIYDDHIEIKTARIRRRLTKCNGRSISTINSGLPEKGAKMVNFDGIKSERALRTLIIRNLRKEYHAYTRPSIDFIHKILEDTYNSDLCYDVSDLQNDVLTFAMNSTNQSEYCVKRVAQMKFKSKEASISLKSSDYNDEAPIVFFDIEIFPNLFVVCYKKRGKDQPVIGMINPSPKDLEPLLAFRLVGYNNRRYDNHLVYAAIVGYDIPQLYDLSQNIIKNGKGFIREAYNISYTDIYDFESAANKTSLKKLEIKMGTIHKELEWAWEEPVPEEKWKEVVDYCKNDVNETENAFDYFEGDYLTRLMLADIADMTANDTTNSLTAKIIFGNDPKPQTQFNYRNMAEPVKNLDHDTYEFLCDACPEMMNTLHGDAESLLPYFPGYEYKNGVSTYKGFTVGEGGFVYAEPGAYGNVALLDIASQHPHSIIAECLFGVKYTKRWKSLVDARINIKHKNWSGLEHTLDGRLMPYVEEIIKGTGKYTAKQLSTALKTPINSAYGLSSAKFDNKFRDIRNVDNIVAKRGALFMIDLLELVKEQGFTVVHIKTDSIKIADATPEIISMVMEFGKLYGYTFEHEATYNKMCLVNKAVYIARDQDGEWSPTGEQFAEPYVFKTLFSHEPIEFADLLQTKSAKTAMYLDFNETLPTGEHDLRFVGKTGAFCPVKPGCGGGLLLRENTNPKTGEKKFDAVSDTKGRRWMEAYMVKELGEEIIDKSYYAEMVDAAKMAIYDHTDPEWFCSDEPYNGSIPHGLPF